MSQEKSLFLRKASGVVRAWSPLDGWIYNVVAINIVIMASFTYMFAAYAVPGGNLPLAMIICGLFCTVEAITFAMMAATMPRSGGDYLFQSRVFGGGVGSTFGHTAIVLAGAQWEANAMFFASALTISPFLAILGYLWGNSSMVNAGVWVATPNGMFLMGVICVAWAAFVNIRGMRFYALLQRYFFWIGLALLVGVMVILGTSSPDKFAGSFNVFMSSTFGVDGAYAGIIAAAKQAGFSGTYAGGIKDTMLMVPIAAFCLIYPAWAVAQAGEIRRGTSLKAQTTQIVGAEVFSWVLGAGLAALIIGAVGKEFMASSAFLYDCAPEAATLPIPPFYGFYAAILTMSPAVVIAIGAMFFLMFWMWHPNIALAASRIWLAMSFDRVLPAKIGEVHAKTHTPVWAIIYFSILSLFMCALYCYGGIVQYILATAFLNIACFGVTNLAAAVLPFRRPRIWKMSPASKYSLGKIPVITITGLIFFGFSVWCMIMYAIDPRYGLNDPVGIIWIAMLFGVSIITYLVAKQYRAKQGIDLGKIYEEIPVE